MGFDVKSQSVGDPFGPKMGRVLIYRQIRPNCGDPGLGRVFRDITRVSKWTTRPTLFLASRGPVLDGVSPPRHRWCLSLWLECSTATWKRGGGVAGGVKKIDGQKSRINSCVLSVCGGTKRPLCGRYAIGSRTSGVQNGFLWVAVERRRHGSAFCPDGPIPAGGGGAGSTTGQKPIGFKTNLETP